MMGAFRFQNLEIWKRASVLNRKCFELADQLEKKHLYRFAEQLRAAALSITNNIAEWLGSSSNADFANLLNFARRSVYETANMLLLLAENRYFDTSATAPLLHELEEISRMITSFKKTLKS